MTPTSTEAFPVAAIEAEMAVIGSMLVAREPLALLDVLDDETDLTLPALQKVAAAIRRLAAAGSPVDCVTVLGELRRVGETVTAAGQTDVGLLLFQYAEAAPVPSSAGWYLRGVLEASLRRRVLEVGIRLAQRAATAGIDELLDCLSADLSAVASVKARLAQLAASS
jgi:replicative DNA helicase